MTRLPGQDDRFLQCGSSPERREHLHARFSGHFQVEQDKWEAVPVRQIQSFISRKSEVKVQIRGKAVSKIMVDRLVIIHDEHFPVLARQCFHSPGSPHRIRL
ncbi:MAG: hypothetical protein WC076_06580 [Terrimicrobiaceae bacterium]